MTELCPHCDKPLAWEKPNCPSCAAYIGAPNVREVKGERAVLMANYENAMTENRKRNCENETLQFADTIAAHSVAVINVWPTFLNQMLKGDKPLYSAYTKQTQAETRIASNINFDRERLGCEGILFGSYAPYICYAALSLDGRGLISYGTCSVTIVENRCKNTGSLLIENSYKFIRKYKILPGDKIPSGFRAVWEDRHYLAVSKLADKINANASLQDFSHLLLHSNGNRDIDEFIEVHLYGTFNRHAFAAIQIPRLNDQIAYSEQAVLEEIDYAAQQLNMPCLRT